jgi:hypothetical protein
VKYTRGIKEIRNKILKNGDNNGAYNPEIQKILDFYS